MWCYPSAGSSSCLAAPSPLVVEIDSHLIKLPTYLWLKHESLLSIQLVWETALPLLLSQLPVRSLLQRMTISKGRGVACQLPEFYATSGR